MARTRLAHRVLILGAQFGGLSVLHWLARLGAPGRVEIVVVSAKPYATYKPDLVHSALSDARFDVKAARIDLVGICRRLGVRLLIDYALGIDPAQGRVHLAHAGPIGYDTLFWATGLDYAWATVPGLGPDAGYTCEDYAARHLAGGLSRFTGGEIAIIAGHLYQDPAVRPALSCTCECALFEWLLLARERLTSTGTLGRTHFTLVTGAARAGEGFGPRGRARVQAILAGAGVDLLEGTRVVRRDPDGVVVEGPGGQGRLVPDLSVWMPPAAGSKLARQSGLDDGWGWVPTNASLQHERWPNVYAVGDLNRITLPKHGHIAMVQARVAAHHWAAETLGTRPGPSFRPRTLSCMQLGFGRALVDWTDALHGGSREILYEGRLGYAAKEAFGAAYRWGRGGMPVMP